MKTLRSREKEPLRLTCVWYLSVICGAVTMCNKCGMGSVSGTFGYQCRYIRKEGFSPERPVGVAAEEDGAVGTGGGYTGSQHSRSGNSLALTVPFHNVKHTAVSATPTSDVTFSLITPRDGIQPIVCLSRDSNDNPVWVHDVYHLTYIIIVVATCLFMCRLGHTLLCYSRDHHNKLQKNQDQNWDGYLTHWHGHKIQIGAGTISDRHRIQAY